MGNSAHQRFEEAIRSTSDGIRTLLELGQSRQEVADRLGALIDAIAGHLKEVGCGRQGKSRGKRRGKRQ